MLATKPATSVAPSPPVDAYLNADEMATVMEPAALEGFVETPYVKGLTERALGYIAAGFPVHFRGPSGTGKTTLAMHVAGRLGRPVVLIHGDEQLTTRDLIGGETGYRVRKVVDRFITHVYKLEEDMDVDAGRILEGRGFPCAAPLSSRLCSQHARCARVQRAGRKTFRRKNHPGFA